MNESDVYISESEKSILNDALEGILILNKENVIEFANKKILELLDFSPDDLKGRDIFSIITEKARELISVYFKHNSQQIINIKNIGFLRNDGIEKHLNFRLKNVFHNDEVLIKRILYLESFINLKSQHVNLDLNKFINIIEHIPETIYSSLPDESSTTIFLSKKWEDWTGIKVEEYLKDEELWIKTVHPDDREKILNQYQMAVRNEEEFHLEYRVVNQETGEIIYIRDHGIPVKNSNDKVIRYDGIMTNITDLVKAEKQLEKSEQKYRHLFQHSPYAVGLFTLDGVLIDINQAANQLMSAHSVGDIKGKHYSEIWTLNERNRPLIELYEKSFHKLKKTQKPLEMEFPINQTKGGILWVHIYASILALDDQKMIQFILQDITEKKKTKRELLKSEKKYRHLFQNSPYAIGILNFDGILLDINKAANQLMSIHNKQDIIGKHYTEILSLNEKNKPLINLYEKSYQKLRSVREPLDFEFKLHQSNNEIIWLHIYASIFTLEDQELIQFILQDITDRKKSEIQLKESQEKFRTISKQSFVSIVILQDNIFKYFNDEFLRVVGYSKEEVNNWEPYEFLKIIHPEDREFVKKQAQKKQTGGRDVIQNYEFRGIKKSGEIYWNEIFSKSVKFNGRPADLIVTLDITERKRAQKKIKESEKKYRHLFQHTPYAIALFSLDGILLDVNEAVNNFMSTHTKDDLIGKHYSEIWSFNQENKTLIDFYDGIFQKLQDTREPVELEFPIKQTLGGTVWTHLYGTIFRLEDQDVIQFILQDVTERRKTQKELKKSERKYRTLFNNASDAIIIHDLNAKILEANKTTVQRLGYKREELKNMSPARFIAPRFLKLIPQRIKELKRKGRAIFESAHITKEGKVIPIEVSLKLIEYQGKPAILNYSRNISERKRAEQQLQESEEKFRTIAEQSAIGIAIYLDRRVQYFNNSFVKILEVPQEELKDSSYEEIVKLVHPEDRQEILKRIKKRERGSTETFNFICRVLTGKKNLKWIEFTSKPISFRNKRGILGTIFDLTDQKKAEESIRKISRLKSELLSRTSHELKTPLVSIKGFTHLILDMKKNELSEDTLSFIEEIKNGTERLEELIKDILEAAKLEFSEEEINREETNLSRLIRGSVKAFTPLLESRNLDLSLNIHENLVLDLDKEKILQVLENLLSNAIKYTPPGGSITISTKIQDDKVIVSLSDTGIGITQEEMKQLFTQFGKIEHYGTGLDVDIEGSGLGLFISKKMIYLHNGEIWAESEGRNKGSTFYFSLPLNP